MMELYIDDKKTELAEDSVASVTLSVAAVTDPEHARAGYTRTLRIPRGGTADEVFSHAGDVHSTAHFNSTAHVGRIEHEGVVLIEGPLQLTAVVDSPPDGYYEVHIIGGAKEWVLGAASRSLRQTGLAYNKTLSAAAIAASWTSDEPVKYFPVVRARSAADYSSGSVVPAMRILTADDYHPFVRCAALVDAIFADSGYTVESSFLRSAEFGSLYVSGNYPVRDASRLRDRMDFLALRAADMTASAGSEGRVYADPYRTAYTVGNLVDVPSSLQSGSSGSVSDGAFSRGGCLRMDDKRAAFVPTEPIEAGFAYRLRYTTDARIKTRHAMQGFDEVYLGEQTSRKFTLANPYPDRRDTLRARGSYKLCVFDHADGNNYQLSFDRLDASGNKVGGSTFSPSPGGFVTLNFSYTDAVMLGNVRIGFRRGATGPYTPYTGDWAVYDGFVEQTAPLDVELLIRTAPETVTSGRPKYFDRIWFGGAVAGQRLTVKEGTSIRPVFYSQPAEGSLVAFADVFAHDASQMEFLKAVRQMYNLVFLTDRRRRKVFIEPARTFYIASDPLMWTSRIDKTKPIRVEELGGDVAKRMTWSYLSGDGAVSRFNRLNGGHLGRWSANVDNAAAANGSHTWENPLFTPSLTTQGVVGGAPSALVVEATGGAGETGTDSLDFPPKIVVFEGMSPLPAGETWGWPSAGTDYPKAAFHAPESGYTLCFEDRDGQGGLHRYWDGDVRLWNSSRRVTMSLKLTAAEIEQVDFRRLVSLSIDGETALYRLEQIVDFNPAQPSTRCVFIKHIF